MSRLAVMTACLLLLSGCGRAPAAQFPVGESASSARTASPSPILLPSPTNDPTANWQTFTSPSLGYSLKTPSNIRYQGSGGAPDPDDYFSNENVGSPQSLDANGIFIDIVVNHDAGDVCLNHSLNSASVERADSLVVDTVPANLRLLSWQGTYGMSLNLQRNSYCYEIVFVAGSKSARDSNVSTAQLMLGSTFRFGTGPKI